MKFKFFGLAIVTLLFSILILLTSCGTTEKTEVSASANAMSTIREYARTNGNTTEPTIDDYQDAGVRGVESNEILVEINNVLKEDEIGAEEIQSPTDIQVLLYERDILDIPSYLEVFSPTISATPIITPISTPTPILTPSSTPTPILTPSPIPTLTPIPTPFPTMESNFKIEDKKGNISLTLKGEGNVTIEIGEEYDYENGYKVKDSVFDYLMGGIGINGETMEINASDYLDNKDKIGTYVIYYTLLDKKKKPILKIWRLITVISNGAVSVSSPQSSLPTPSATRYQDEVYHGKWVKPSKSACNTNGGKYIDYNSKNNECTADWESAKRICSDSGYELATSVALKSILNNCNKFYQTCYREQGFSSSRYWSSYSMSGNSTAWLVDFRDGLNGYYEKNNVESVMCLRTPPTPTPIPTPVSTVTPTPIPSDYNGDHSTANGISIKFKYFFPSNTVYLDDKTLEFNPKDFKGIKDDGTDVTNYIMVKISYNSSVISEYDKAKEGTYLFKYFFGDKEIAEYSFTTIKKEY